MRMRTALALCLSLLAIAILAQPDDDPPLQVMKIGLGEGTVTGTGINCGTDCDQGFAAIDTVTLTATAAAGSTFAGWGGACSGTGTCTLAMTVARAVTANFTFNTAITTITDFRPDGATGLQSYLTAHPEITTPARFIAALPADFKQNWILMSRSESLQTGTARTPRILMPNADARFVFTIGMTPHASYPGAHPNAIEYMQYDSVQKNFRFHEIIVDNIPAMPAPSTIPARSRGVSIDDGKCGKCHSTRNVINRTTSAGTSGPPGGAKFKNKPNWDTYDSWGGMSPFNRDRIYQGSLEAAGFRHIFNLWNWRNSAENDSIRQVLEQLALQPPTINPTSTHTIVRNINSTTDTGHIVFGFDALAPIATTPASTNYSFGGTPVAASTVNQGGRYVTMRHSADPNPSNENYTNPGGDEGRGVQLFDLIGGLDGTLNAERIADELIDHKFATGSVPIDVRPITLAIAMDCLAINPAGSGSVTSTPALTVNMAFFNARHAITGINALVNDSRTRAQSIPQRKANIQKIDLDRSVDPYLMDPPSVNGLIQEYGAVTPDGTSTATTRIRKEVFQRPLDLGSAGTGIPLYVDREDYGFNTNRVALFRYFLEPLGVSVDKWSMGVRGRSRTYSFADVFGNYRNTLEGAMKTSLGLASPNCTTVIGLVNTSLASLPAATAPPKYTDVQRIFNKSCIECHGGLHYPPYENTGGSFDLSEDENPMAGVSPMVRPHGQAAPLAASLMGLIYRYITRTNETCPPAGVGMMPCGGPMLSQADIETIRRWIVGGATYTEGDPHIRTIDDVHYDFQSAGEFVLLRDLDFEIQTRQTAVDTGAPLPPNGHTGLSSCVSINTAAAVRVGPHRITVQPDNYYDKEQRPLVVRIDGKAVQLESGEIRLREGGRVLRTANGNLQVETAGGTVVIITSNWWDYRKLWYMNVDVRQARGTEGVMGAIAPNNWLPALPDGTLLGPRPADLHQRYVDLYETFEKAWRVTDATSLFDYAPGMSTASFTIEAWPVEEPKTCDAPPVMAIPKGPPPKEPLGVETARQICGDIRDKNRNLNCVQDVMVTAEPGFAKTYAQTEQAMRNEPPAPPALAGPADRVTMADARTFVWAPALDREQQTVTYRYCIWPVDKTFTLNDCDSQPIRFSATQIRSKKLSRRTATLQSGAKLRPGQSYFWKVIAEDANGLMSESETRRVDIK